MSPGKRPPSSALPSWSELRARLESAGFRPSRGLGQNFLVDGNMARAIVRDAQLSAGDRVLEVGPGAGQLSLRLVEHGVRLLAVEVDARLAALCRELLAPFEGAQVIQADVLASKHRLAPAVQSLLPADGPWHVVANLPYSAGTPFLAVASRLENPPRSMTVLLQKELVERLTAVPDTSAWGPLGAKLQLLYEPHALRAVPSNLFWPRPRVESTLARLSLRAERPAADAVRAFDRLVEGLFQGRRKTLARRLGELLESRAAALDHLRQLGIEGRARPETLGIEELLELARRVGLGHGSPNDG